MQQVVTTPAEAGLFSSLPISEQVRKGLKGLGFTKPTPVQQMSIAPILDGNDVVMQAPTGTGKTFAFGIPLLEQVNAETPFVQALIICPTRELCVQTADALYKLARYKQSVRITSIYGGQAMQRQIYALKKRPQIIVATPGRLMDHLRRRTIRLQNLRYLVLDEADEMLNMGFRKDIDTVLESIPGKHQTTLFSATMSKEIRNLTKQYLTNPLYLQVESTKESRPSIKQHYVEVRQDQKADMLSTILSEKEHKLALVFCNTKHMTDRLAKKLRGSGFIAQSLHGDMRQNARDKVIGAFRKGGRQVLVATDVAARGIDVKDIDVVINYDIPMQAEYYIHRIGRTGRAKKHGVSYVIMNNKEKGKLQQLIRETKADIKPAKFKLKAMHTSK